MFILVGKRQLRQLNTEHFSFQFVQLKHFVFLNQKDVNSVVKEHEPLKHLQKVRVYIFIHIRPQPLSYLVFEMSNEIISTKYLEVLFFLIIAIVC